MRHRYRAIATNSRSNEATKVHPNYCFACPVGRTIQLAREAKDDAGAVHGVLTSNSTLGAFCGSIDGSVRIERRPHGGWRLDLPTRLRDISKYGDNYYLVVRCEGKWAARLVEAQTFAIAVELWHEVPLQLYQQIAVTVGA
ncbi:hypothetical protein MYG64_36160 (plasmid) [Ensifer adhaerens]|uniref:hypothetical protein n=1 Tax=Ensifer adhaerens TaxID=106592 RepID=UPI00210146B1|nr:hypothetical protein [Ensifer adhaerens]UTV41905.1 hypothetical protein MYG64_36160 [Ensifer adhaerens]